MLVCEGQYKGEQVPKGLALEWLDSSITELAQNGLRKMDSLEISQLETGIQKYCLPLSTSPVKSPFLTQKLEQKGEKYLMLCFDSYSSHPALWSEETGISS